MKENGGFENESKHFAGKKAIFFFYIFLLTDAEGLKMRSNLPGGTVPYHDFPTHFATAPILIFSSIFIIFSLYINTLLSPTFSIYYGIMNAQYISFKHFLTADRAPFD